MNVVANISYAPNYAIVSDPYSVKMQENTNENNSEYEHFSRSDRANIMLRGYFVVLGNLGKSTIVFNFLKQEKLHFFLIFLTPISNITVSLCCMIAQLFWHWQNTLQKLVFLCLHYFYICTSSSPI